MDRRDEPVQQRYAPQSTCFGCGPANPLGLRLESFLDDGRLVACWSPAAHHQAFDGILNGGIIGALLDCHANWAAAMAFMRRDGADEPPCTVTAVYTIELLRPTPLDPVGLVAEVVKLGGRSATVEATLASGDTITARCRGTFVAVAPGHPAYRRW